MASFPKFSKKYIYICMYVYVYIMFTYWVNVFQGHKYTIYYMTKPNCFPEFYDVCSQM